MVQIRRDTKTIGDLSEIEIIAALTRAGYRVSIPFGENQRYDLIADDGAELLRIQVKMGRLRKGAILFNCCSTHAHRGFSSRSYFGQVDAFAVYCPAMRSAYLVPVADATETKGTLRVEGTKNGQTRRIRWASGYVIEGGFGEASVGAVAGGGVHAAAPNLPL